MKFNKTKKAKLPRDFSVETYLKLNPDVAAAKIDPIEHYLAFGMKEKRQYIATEGSSSEAFTKYLARYINTVPNDNNAFDFFKGLWTSKVPGIENTGSFDGFNDARIVWVIDEIGDIENFTVLELGPLEGAHTYMLENAGATVTAIEANYGAFIRCLMVKNVLSMKSKFVLGDFQKLNFMANEYDLVIASGVLYHMSDPVGLLQALSQTTTRLFIWTHYFEENLELWEPNILKRLHEGKWDTQHVITQPVSNLNVRMVRQFYGESLGWEGFCGGPEEYSYWIYKDDLLSLVNKLGFSDIKINFDAPNHPNGPSFALLAQK